MDQTWLKTAQWGHQILCLFWKLLLLWTNLRVRNLSGAGSRYLNEGPVSPSKTTDRSQRKKTGWKSLRHLVLHIKWETTECHTKVPAISMCLAEIAATHTLSMDGAVPAKKQTKQKHSSKNSSTEPTGQWTGFKLSFLRVRQDANSLHLRAYSITS